MQTLYNNGFYRHPFIRIHLYASIYTHPLEQALLLNNMDTGLDNMHTGSNDLDTVQFAYRIKQVKGLYE